MEKDFETQCREHDEHHETEPGKQCGYCYAKQNRRIQDEIEKCSKGTEGDLKLLGKLFGRDIFIDLTDCDKRVFEHAERFFKTDVENAEKLLKIKEILNR